MRPATHLICAHVLLTLLLCGYESPAQYRDYEISRLREMERALEKERDRYADNIKKSHTDAGPRSSHVVFATHGGDVIIPREEFVTRLAVAVWTEEITKERAIVLTDMVNKYTAAASKTWRSALIRVENSLADVKRRLLAVLKTPASNGTSNGVAAKIDLSGAWNVTAKGNNGRSYTATLRLTKNADDAYTGSFAWSGSTASGVENVKGRFDPATRTLTLSGAVASGNLVPGVYTIEVSQNGRSLENGTWTGSDGGGRWSAGK